LIASATPPAAQETIPHAWGDANVALATGVAALSVLRVKECGGRATDVEVHAYVYAQEAVGDAAIFARVIALSDYFRNEGIDPKAILCSRAR